MTVDGAASNKLPKHPIQKITVRYYQDKRLRLHLLDALEDIEVALKPK